MENLVGFMAPEAQQQLLVGAREAKLKGSYLSRLEKKAKPNGTLTLDEADLVAKTDALEFTKDLFYDLSDRSQFFDVTRLLFPFGEAFQGQREEVKKYSELVARNPVLPYRLGQGIQGGRNGDLDGDGRGSCTPMSRPVRRCSPGRGPCVDGGTRRRCGRVSSSPRWKGGAHAL